MKISLSNLFLAVLAASIAIAWCVDRKEHRSEIKKLESEIQNRELSESAAFRVLVNARYTSMYRAHTEEHKVYDILDKYDLDEDGLKGAAGAYKVLAVHQSYSKIDDKDFADSLVELVMKLNEWYTADDVVSAIDTHRRLANEVTEDKNSLRASLTEYLERIDK